MSQASLRFYAELNDFLPPNQRQRPLPYEFEVNPAVKDAIEAVGVPHPEVDLILAQGRSVDFLYLLQDGDRISVYPYFRRLDPGSFSRVRPEPLNETRFVVDVHLGRLARYLRMLGFDTLYQNDYADETLAHISSSEQRLLLTRDRGLLKRSVIVYGYCLRTTNPRRQLTEVLHRFDLFDSITPFQRCLTCNGRLQPVAKQDILDQLSSNTEQYYDQFHQCQVCHKLFWKGSHFQRMERFVERLLLSRDG